MTTLEKEASNATTNGPARLQHNRQEVLAAMGEAYMALEGHQFAAQQCATRIQQLRSLLQQLEEKLNAAPPEEEKVRPAG